MEKVHLSGGWLSDGVTTTTTMVVIVDRDYINEDGYDDKNGSGDGRQGKIVMVVHITNPTRMYITDKRRCSERA